MSVWDELVDQEVTVSHLRQAVYSQKPHHAWLFTGPPGSGRSNVARAFAAALQCEEKTPGCGKCKTCVTILCGTHADITTVATDKVTISIEEVRQLIIKAQDRPSSGKWRIIIVEDADRMTERTSNVLLKSLEEPPPRTLWMLCAPSPADVLVTIRSRCQQLNLKVPSVEQIAQLLFSRDGIDLELARQTARMAQGHIGVAKWLARSPEARRRRAKILSIPSQIHTVGQAMRAAAFLMELSQKEAKDSTEIINEEETKTLLHSFGISEHEKLPQHLRAHVKRLQADQERRATRSQKDVLDRTMLDLLSFYRDVLMIQLGVSLPAINPDVEAAIITIAQGSSAEITMHTIDAIALARRRLGTNAAPLLAIEAMMLALP